MDGGTMKTALLPTLMLTMAATAVSAKGVTTRITLRDATLQTSIDITDASVLTAFNVWAGPGTFANGVEGTKGFIIDWPAGIARDRPRGLGRYEVMFYVRYLDRSTEELVYVVLYEHEPASGRGFVYLPGRSEHYYGRNVRTILHGLEGHWFYASEAWHNAVTPLLPLTKP
jgi:hypothetical protein